MCGKVKCRNENTYENMCKEIHIKCLMLEETTSKILSLRVMLCDRKFSDEAGEAAI